MKKMFSLLSVFVLGCLFSYAFAAEYYVSPTGSDYNDGTKVSPFKTIAKAVALLEDGVATTIYLEEDATFTLEGPETIKVGENKNVTIKGKNSIISGKAKYNGIQLLRIGKKTDAKVVGIVFQNTSVNEGIPGAGLFFEGNKLEVDSCTFQGIRTDTSGSALASHGKDVIITNCVFDDNRVYGGYGVGGVLYQCGPFPETGAEIGSLIIRNCSFTNNLSNEINQPDTKGDVIGLHQAYRNYYPDQYKLYSNVNYVEVTNCLFKDNVTSDANSTLKYPADIYLKDTRSDIELNLINNTFFKSRTLFVPFFFNAPKRLINNVFYNTATTDQRNYVIATSSGYEDGFGRDAFVAYNNVIVGQLGYKGENFDDPCFTTEKAAYGNQIVAKISDVGLSPLVETEGSYVPYLPIASESSILVNSGLSSTLEIEGINKELIPATDMRGLMTNGVKDIGAFEYGGQVGILDVAGNNTQNLFTIGRSGDNAVITNVTDGALDLKVYLLDGRVIYEKTGWTGDLLINKSELAIPNGVLIFSVTDGNVVDAKKAVLF